MNNTRDIRAISDSLKQSQRLCFLTGAVVSTLSGIPDFQSTDSTWRHPIPRSEAISRRFFEKDPETFWSIYHGVFHSKAEAAPNAVHDWMASMEEGRIWVETITQNVDGLHGKAGSTTIHQVHGRVNECICVNRECRSRISQSFAHGTSVLLCSQCHGPLKPNVVLFGEMTMASAQSELAAFSSDLLVVMGTSLQVTPVSLLPLHNKVMRPYSQQVWVGNTEPPKGYSFDHVFIGDLGEFVEAMTA